LSYVITTISLPKKQSKFIKDAGYSPSRLLQNQINELMKKSEGQTLRERPADKPQERGSNNG